MAAATLDAPPAPAADIGEIECPVTRLTAGQRAALAQGVNDLAARADPRFDPFKAKIEECSRDHGWSPDASETARLFNLGNVGQWEARRLLEGMGIEVGPVERAILADRALSAALDAGEFSDAEVRALVLRLQPALTPLVSGRQDDEALLGLLGRYIVFRATAAASRRRFSRD